MNGTPAAAPTWSARARAWLREQFGYLRTRWRVLLHDAVVAALAWLLAYWFRSNLGIIPETLWHGAVSYLPLVVAVHLFTFVVFGVPRGLWRFISLPDLIRIVKAVAAGTLLVAVLIFFTSREIDVPRSVFILHGLFLVLFMVGPRLGYRLAKDRHVGTASEQRAMIAGAGAAGEMLVRDLLRARPREYEPVCFVDDDPRKQGQEIHGIPVSGDCEAIPELCARWEISLIIIAMPSATTAEMRRVVEICEGSGVAFQTLPKISDIVRGRADSSQLREVRIEDLLGREPVSLDWEHIASELQGKRIMVTGGGGSIGSELCRQLLRVDPASLLILENSEFNLYSVSQLLDEEKGETDVIPILGDVRDRDAVGRTFRAFRPQVVFHAAAYKHVPLLQHQVRAAVQNNVLGTRAIADAAARHGAETMVLISTDKAVNPTSVMGACKRLAEIYCQALGTQAETRYITVRFGNVLGSAGSVVPLFKRQIEAGGPVTVTHPEITRYFMTITEACQLILQASAIGDRDRIYVLDMGEPIRIDYLARQMIRLSGLEPGEDIEIRYTGLRPGEKMYEELFHIEEGLTDTGYEKILQAQNRPVDLKTILRALDRLQADVENFNEIDLLQILHEQIPELELPQDASFYQEWSRLTVDRP